MRSSWLFFVPLAFAAAGIAFAENSAPQGTTTIALPTGVGPTFKPGPGAKAAGKYCTTCHSSAYVAIQPPLNATQWAAEVTKMRKVYGASIPDDAAATIVQYLTTEYGKP